MSNQGAAPGGYVIVIAESGGVTVEALPEDGSLGLEKLQQLVGGYIQAPPGFDRLFASADLVAALPRDVLALFDGQASIPCSAYCDEEGKMNRREANMLATQLWAYALVDNGMVKAAPDGEVWMSDVLVGPVVIVVGEIALRKEREA